MLNTVFETKDGTLTVKPAGEMDSMTSPVFDEEVRARLDGVSHIVFDMERVDYLSSAALRVFLALEQRLEQTRADMKLIHVNENIMEIFELVGFTTMVTVE